MLEVRTRGYCLHGELKLQYISSALNCKQWLSANFLNGREGIDAFYRPRAEIVLCTGTGVGTSWKIFARNEVEGFLS